MKVEMLPTCYVGFSVYGLRTLIVNKGVVIFIHHGVTVTLGHNKLE